MEMDRSFDEVDPRVQIELERLNTATDDINKLEVDLDESRAGFRQLLCESTVRIDSLAKKLGTCIERSRPYYDARMKAKDALQETQHAAVRFERANSAHSAAREMVFLAEEGLSTEGRTFDHAWQEMLNHATMRVNESEAERTLSELEHRRTSSNYHCAETRVQQLQKDLKRAITKSSLNARRSMLQINSLAYRHQLQLLPYFEMKAQFNQVLEDQKRRVKSLETQVGQAKTTYAQALRNLEQISDEIHRTRKSESGIDPLGARGAGVGADSPLPNPDAPEPRLMKTTPPGASSNSDVWSDSTGTGPPDSDSGEEYLKLPDKLGPSASPTVNKSYESSANISEYLGLSSLSDSVKKSVNEPMNRPMAELPIRSQDTFQSASMSPRHSARKPANKPVVSNYAEKRNAARRLDFTSQDKEEVKMEERLVNTAMKRDDSQTWTEISLIESPEEMRPFAKMGQNAPKIDRDYIHYSTLDNSSRPEPSTFGSLLRNPLSFTLPKGENGIDRGLPSSPAKKVANWIPSLTSKSPEEDFLLGDASDPDRTSSPRPKLDSSLSGWISRSTTEAPDQSSASVNRRQSLDMLWGGPTTDKVRELLSHGMMMLNISSLTERRASEPRVHSDIDEDVPFGNADDDIVDDEIRFVTRETRMTKKVPSPLEKSLGYLTAEDDSQSDSESLASVEMLTDDQITSLMFEQDLQDACEQVLGTPMSEISPLIQELKDLEETSAAREN